MMTNYCPFKVRLYYTFMSASEWGSEVYPGVFFSRGTAPSLNAAGGGEATPEVTVQRIHEAIGKCREVIKKLTTSNDYMLKFLKERGYGTDAGVSGVGYDLPPLASVSEDDRVVHEAIVENKAIIKEREAELEVLLALISGQHCAREAPVDEAPPRYDAEEEDDSDEEGSSASEEEYTGPLEDVSSMGQLLGSGAGPTRNTFTL